MSQWLCDMETGSSKVRNEEIVAATTDASSRWMWWDPFTLQNWNLAAFCLMTSKTSSYSSGQENVMPGSARILRYSHLIFFAYAKTRSLVKLAKAATYNIIEQW